MATTSQVVSVSTAAPVNETQNVVVDATGGSFTLTYGGQTTSAITTNAAGAAVQSALEALSSIGSGNIGVSRSGSADSYTYACTFQGTLAATNVAQMTSDATSLTGGAGTATVTTATPGSPRTSPQQLDIDPATGTARGCTVYLKNTGSSTAYIGGGTVTSSTGYPLAASGTMDEVELRQDANLYAICADGTNTTVAILQVDN